MEVVHAQEDSASASQWSRARDILDDMRKKRSSLEEMGHTERILSHTPSSPTGMKLTTVNEHEACEAVRAKEILDTMKSRREDFSKILIGMSQLSPAATESTAALSWVSSSSENEHEVYSEEGMSNCYEDYLYRSDDDDDSTSGSSSSGSELTYEYSEDSTDESANVLSTLPHEQSMTEELFDVRNMIMPANLPVVSGNPLSSDQKDALERKTIQTSSSRNLYREGSSWVSTQESTDKRDRRQPYLKRERPGSETSKLRAELADIAERRAKITNMLHSISELKNHDFDLASMILSDPSSQRPPWPTPSKATSESDLPRDIYILPSPRTQSESQSETFEQVSDAEHSSLDAADYFDWEGALGGLVLDSESESMFYSDSKTGLTDQSPPFRILYKVKETKPKQNVSPSPTRSADLKPVARSIEDCHCGGLNQIAELTDYMEEFDSLNSRRRSPLAIAHDYMIPYNIEDRFCGGLYHIASLSSSPPQLAQL